MTTPILSASDVVPIAAEVYREYPDATADEVYDAMCAAGHRIGIAPSTFKTTGVSAAARAIAGVKWKGRAPTDRQRPQLEPAPEEAPVIIRPTIQPRHMLSPKELARERRASLRRQAAKRRAEDAERMRLNPPTSTPGFRREGPIDRATKAEIARTSYLPARDFDYRGWD